MAGSYRLDRLDCIGWIASAESYKYWSSWIHSEKLAFYALAGIMGEIGLILARWDRQTIWDRGGTEVGWRDQR